jgi:hypothetical protein
MIPHHERVVRIFGSVSRKKGLFCPCIGDGGALGTATSSRVHLFASIAFPRSVRRCLCWQVLGAGEVAAVPAITVEEAEIMGTAALLRHRTLLEGGARAHAILTVRCALTRALLHARL